MSQLLPERGARFAPERWEPFSELDQVTERMRRMLEQTFAGLGAPLLTESGGWSPLVDIEETDDAYLIEAELPGVEEKDVNVELIGNELVISGEIREREHQGTLRRRTRRSGRFDYRVALPDPVDEQKVDAKLSNGVLTIRVPRSERAQRRKIAVKS
jgi:HSP20 family protein